MGDGFFKSELSSTDYLKAARGIVEQSGKREDKERWWNIYDGLRDKLSQHNNNWDDITMTQDEESWRTRNREKYDKQLLTTDQLLALRQIDFPFAQNIANGRKPKTTTKLQRTLELKASFETGPPLSEQEQRELNKNMSFYRSSYAAGTLSARTAEKLEIGTY